MSTVRGQLSGTGTQTSALAIGGNPPSLATTEEWTGAAFQTKTVTVS
jgi:hypothetical protein